MVLSRSHKASSNNSGKFVNPSFGGNDKSLFEWAYILMKKVLSAWETVFGEYNSGRSINPDNLTQAFDETKQALDEFSKMTNLKKL